jgi:hypothetical protein
MRITLEVHMRRVSIATAAADDKALMQYVFCTLCEALEQLSNSHALLAAILSVIISCHCHHAGRAHSSTAELGLS